MHHAERYKNAISKSELNFVSSAQKISTVARVKAVHFALRTARREARTVFCAGVLRRGLALIPFVVDVFDAAWQVSMSVERGAFE